MYLAIISSLTVVSAAAIQAFPFPQRGDPTIINPIVKVTQRGIEKRAQCTATLSECSIIANELQAKYWNSNAGNYNGGGFWDDVVSRLLPSFILSDSVKQNHFKEHI
jgi:hypothetical protein